MKGERKHEYKEECSRRWEGPMQRPGGRTVLGKLEEGPSQRPLWLEQSDSSKSRLRVEKGTGSRHQGERSRGFSVCYLSWASSLAFQF